MASYDDIKNEIFGSISAADPTLKQTDLDFMEQSVLLSCLKCGANEEIIADVLGYDPEFVRQIGSRLRNSGIWKGDGISKVHIHGWNDEEKGGVAFLMDAMVAGGRMVISEIRDGKPLYSMTDEGRREVERKFGADKP